MAKLAIKGHATRGKEVIGLLEMLGGKKDNHCCGGFLCIYFINNYGYIESCDGMQHLDYLQLTLEEFLENFPFKVGDEVLINDDENDVYTVKSMEWNEFFNRVAYRIEAVDGVIHDNAWFASEMLLFKRKKEESMEEKLMPRIDLTRYCKDKYILDLGDYEIKEENGVTYMIHKKPQYPKTYEECCGVLKIPNDERYIDIDVPLGYNKLLSTFTELLICRDAYWKLAGDWKFDFAEKCYYICIKYGKIQKFESLVGCDIVLAFPTEEMRDAFYEYFKDLIESCKEFL